MKNGATDQPLEETSEELIRILCRLSVACHVIRLFGRVGKAHACAGGIREVECETFLME